MFTYFYVTCTSPFRRPRRNPSVFSCKMRLSFILTVNLYATDDPPPPTPVFFREKCALYQRPQIPCVFSGKMHLAFLLTVNSYGPRPTAPGFRIFFQLKRASREPFQIPSVFSSKTRLAFNAIVNLYDSRPTASTFLVSFIENGHRRNPATFLGFTFIVFSQVQRVLEFTCDDASPCRMSFLFPRENEPHRNCREVPKLEQRHMLTKEHCP